MSRDITTDTENASAADTIHPVLLVKLEFDGGNVMLHSELGDIVFAGDTYTGAGILGGIGVAEEVSDLSKTPITLTLSGLPTDPDSESAIISALLNEQYQGRRATVYLGYLNLTTRALIADPTILYRGRMDVPDFQQDSSITISLSVSSRFEAWSRALARRYNNADQQSRYPGDTGLQFVEQSTEKNVVWGGAG